MRGLALPPVAEMMTNPREADLRELDHAVGLYKFYVEVYTKGMAFYLAIAGALITLAVGSGREYSSALGYVGLASSAGILIPIWFGLGHEKTLSAELARCALTCGTKPVSTRPLRIMAYTCIAFWSIITGGWCYVAWWLA